MRLICLLVIYKFYQKMPQIRIGFLRHFSLGSCQIFNSPFSILLDCPKARAEPGQDEGGREKRIQDGGSTPKSLSVTIYFDFRGR